MRRVGTGSALALVAVIWSHGSLSVAGEGGPVDVDPEELKPGLVGVYRSLTPDMAVLHKVDPKLAFALSDSTPHPRIPPGPFEVAWSGLIKVQDSGPIAFSAFV